MVAYQQKMARYYNSHFKNEEFRVGNLVLYQIEISQPAEHGKLAPRWEGPYQVEEIVRPGTYHLK